MVFGINMIKKAYAELPENVKKIRELVGSP